MMDNIKIETFDIFNMSLSLGLLQSLNPSSAYFKVQTLKLDFTLTIWRLYFIQSFVHRPFHYCQWRCSNSYSREIGRSLLTVHKRGQHVRQWQQGQQNQIHMSWQRRLINECCQLLHRQSSLTQNWSRLQLWCHNLDRWLGTGCSKIWGMFLHYKRWANK